MNNGTSERLVDLRNLYALDILFRERFYKLQSTTVLAAGSINAEFYLIGKRLIKRVATGRDLFELQLDSPFLFSVPITTRPTSPPLKCCSSKMN